MRLDSLELIHVPQLELVHQKRPFADGIRTCERVTAQGDFGGFDGVELRDIGEEI